jgi:hypothetical protein
MAAHRSLSLLQYPTTPTLRLHPVDGGAITSVGPPDPGGHVPDDIVGPLTAGPAPSPEALLRELQLRGISVVLRDDQISCRHDGHGLTPELRSQLRERAPQLKRLLAPKPRAICAVRNRHCSFPPKTLTLVLHNRTGLNHLGQDAATHPFALINERAWAEADWNLTDCTWYRSEADANGL